MICTRDKISVIRDYWQRVHCGEAAEAESGGPGYGWHSSTKSKQTPSTTIQILQVKRQSEDNIWGSQGLRQFLSSIRVKVLIPAAAKYLYVEL